MLTTILQPLMRSYLRSIGYNTYRIPNWLRPVLHYYAATHTTEHLIPRFMAEDQAGAGTTNAWWEPHTPTEIIVQWFDDEVANTLHIQSCDRFDMALISCTEATYQMMQTQPIEVYITDAQLLARWNGPRPAWWTEGREQMAAAIPIDHHGLYGRCVGMGSIIDDTLFPEKVD